MQNQRDTGVWQKKHDPTTTVLHSYFDAEMS